MNTGTAAINLSDVKVRYYFTNDGTQTGDYSFNATATNYVDLANTTGCITGSFKWGTEP